MKQLSHLLQRITPNLAVILLGLFFILGSDENSPIITILDDNPAIIKLGDVYTDAGATAEDKQDGKVDVITTGLDAIDTSIAKHYTVTYTATDLDKNISIATRLVKIIEEPVTMGRLNDTGITRCADNNSNDLNCPVSTYPNQDAQSGRDATHNDDSDGHAGFSFTKISSTGTELAVSATQWSCVKDNVTGLIWEVKTDDGGLRDKDNKYTWYNPDKNNNGGYAGTSGGNTTNSFVTAVNAIHLCGYFDWRMPSREELHSLLLFDRYNPMIDTTFFPNTPWVEAFFPNPPRIFLRFLSSSPYASDSNSVWSVDFHEGLNVEDDKDTHISVRLVRSGQ